MDMNKAFSLKTNDRAPKWRVYDASGKTLGRLATEIAVALRGKDKTIYTPHIDAGDYVVVLNCDKVNLTGKKLENKIYWRHSAWLRDGTLCARSSLAGVPLPCTPASCA